jgi:WD40 repeat protein
MWDIRRKSWIFTYKGHRITVNSLKFSPDGQWIASGGEDGLVKVAAVILIYKRKLLHCNKNINFNKMCLKMKIVARYVLIGILTHHKAARKTQAQILQKMAEIKYTYTKKKQKPMKKL